MPYSMQLTKQIPNDPPWMGAKSTTTSNHPSTPSCLVSSTNIPGFLHFLNSWMNVSEHLKPTYRELHLIFAKVHTLN